MSFRGTQCHHISTFMELWESSKTQVHPACCQLLLYSLQKRMQLSGCLRLWVGHVALWKCQNLSMDDKWSSAQHWAVLWNSWLWVSWTWNSYCTAPFQHQLTVYIDFQAADLTSKQDFSNPAKGSICLSLAAMDGSSLAFCPKHCKSCRGCGRT